MTRNSRTLRSVVVALSCTAFGGCLPNDEPQTGSQTNWLRACLSDADCGSNSCQCGVCTHSCSADSSCADLPGSSCVAATDSAAIALCDGSIPSAGALCLTRCGTASVCSGQAACIAGACTATSLASAHVAIDLQTRFQTLSGLGATLAYAEPEVIQYSNANELYSAMFADLGLDTLRLRNRYGYFGDNDLASAATIVNAGTASLGHRPTVVLASWSPPGSLKSNGSTVCQGEEDSCTLVRQATGGFDYDAYAGYWRDSLDAYAAVGVVPDYVAIQNNPDFIPTAAKPLEGCKFLPTEGPLTVSVGGKERPLQFPGYAEAIRAVLGRFQGLGVVPKIIAPEASGASLVSDFVRYLDPSSFDAIGHHLYGSVPGSPDLNQLRQLHEMSQSSGRPVFQTEMAADGLGTAVLLHHTLVTEGASAYLQNAIVGPSVESGALIVVADSKLALQPAYHALRQFSRFTDPGWVRAQADSDQASLLVSTWISPKGAVTVVVVNAEVDSFDVELGLEVTSAAHSQVTRTVFDGVERSADLGSLPSNRIVRVPGHSVVTVAVDGD